MPAAYSHNLRWRAIWLTEIVGIEVEEFLRTDIERNDKSLYPKIYKLRKCKHGYHQ